LPEPGSIAAWSLALVTLVAGGRLLELSPLSVVAVAAWDDRQGVTATGSPVCRHRRTTLLSLSLSLCRLAG